jgi:hypothetical protein
MGRRGGGRRRDFSNSVASCISDIDTSIEGAEGHVARVIKSIPRPKNDGDVAVCGNGLDVGLVTICDIEALIRKDRDATGI